ncbi:MAG TPA: carboxypeptidase-like regulatory domain-containing protein [Terriglobales bacterium]|nr:carboxypeptidase-like regulatory domain-containing protein [Terriglobales bacterium]
MCVLTVWMFLGAGVASARAQSSSGTVTGQITDPSGAAIPGAVVLLIDDSTGTARTVQSNATGRYLFLNVNLGTYDISVSKEGFQQSKLSKQPVTVDIALTANFKLTIGASTQTVEVTASPGADLQTMSATMGTTISGSAALALPNLGRDASSLLLYQANTNPMTGNVAGAATDQNSYTLDGGNISNDLDGSSLSYTGGFSTNQSGSGVVPTPVESIEEVRMDTNNPSAAYANASGGEIVMATKRGSKDWHGSAYDFYQANWLNADSWSNNRSGIPLQKTHQNRFGFSLGGQMLPNMLGGPTFFFVNYEGRRYPEAGTSTLTVPSALMRQGILQFADAKGNIEQWNLATAQNCGSGGNLPCDPRGIGINPVVSLIWNKYMPMPNNASAAGDTLNTQGYQAQINLPQKNDSVAFRMDHNFGKNWQLMGSYRFYRAVAPTSSQADWGGVLPGDTLGVPTATRNVPVQPRYLVFGLTGQLSPNVTNQTHFNFVRNWWAWETAGVPNVASSLGIAASVNIDNNNGGIGLMPINEGWGTARQRIWDGNDWNYSDDLSWIKGNHFFSVGGDFLHDWMHHTRDDNAAGSLTAPEYIIGNSGSVVTSANYRPPKCNVGAGLVTGCITASSTSWDTLYYETLGVLSNANVFASRVGPDLTLQPQGTMLFDTSVIDSWSVYAADSWHVSPSLTLTYGLNWGAQMPPVEANGKQVMLVDAAGNPINTTSYINLKEQAALRGQAYNPVVGYAPVGDINGGEKYPFSPYYGGVSPRLSMAWNPTFDGGVLGSLFGTHSTVLRAGWSRVNDRTNGVNMVLVPLLGVGFGQADTCFGVSMADSGCAGQRTVNASNAFRIGTDGKSVPLPPLPATLSTPVQPGVNSAPVSNGDTLAPDYRPGVNDQFTVSLQRQLPHQMLVELGWTGVFARHVYATEDLDAVPYMMTLGGQTFAQAYANVAQQLNAGKSPTQVSVQPFFEKALQTGPGNYCQGFSSCTAAVAANEGPNGTGNITNSDAWSTWADLEGNWVFGPDLLASQGLGGAELSGSDGRSNYNAGTITVQKRSTNLTLDANFTYAHQLDMTKLVQALVGSQTVNPFDRNYDYGTDGSDIRYLFNLTALYRLPYANQNGLVGRVLGGWSVAPILTWHSGAPLEMGDISGGGEFGACSCNTDFGVSAIPTGPIPSTQVIQGFTSDGVTGFNQDVTKNNPHGIGINAFSNPTAVFNSFRLAYLGVDSNANTIFGRGFPFWNLDMNLQKDVKITERMGATVNVEMINALNHVNWNDPNLNLSDQASFGDITGVSPGPRTIELGLRLHW